MSTEIFHVYAESAYIAPEAEGSSILDPRPNSIGLC